MMAMLRRFMLFLLTSGNGWSMISPENRDPLFRIALKTWSWRALQAPKKEARPKGPGAPYSLQRNIVSKRLKARLGTAFLLVTGVVAGHLDLLHRGRQPGGGKQRCRGQSLRNWAPATLDQEVL